MRNFRDWVLVLLSAVVSIAAWSWQAQYWEASEYAPQGELVLAAAAPFFLMIVAMVVAFSNVLAASMTLRRRGAGWLNAMVVGAIIALGNLPWWEGQSLRLPVTLQEMNPLWADPATRLLISVFWVAAALLVIVPPIIVFRYPPEPR